MAIQKGTTGAACALCGLTAHRPLKQEYDGSTLIFCCGGCRQVYQILAESGQAHPGTDLKDTPLYQQCLQMGLIARPDAVDDDIPSASSPVPVTIPHEGDTVDAVRELALQVGGMWCSSCAWLIEHAVGRLRGVESCRVSFASDVLKVVYLPARTSTEDITQTVQRLGYTAEPYGEASVTHTAQDEARRSAFTRAIVALIFAMNVMMFTIALYVGFFQGLDAESRLMLPRWAFVLSLPVVWAGWPIFQRAWSAARHGSATMETLITIGAGTAFVYSTWAMLHGQTLVYFDTADMLVALILIGKHVEGGAKGQATQAIALLHALLPRKAMVRAQDGRELLVAMDKLAEGDIVVVRAGDRIPADGVIEQGQALIDESLLTGESRPVTKGVGDEVTGATIATDAPLTIRVTRAGESSTVAQMIATVEEALAGKSATERWADQIARRFVPAILVLSAVTALLMLAAHAPASAIVLRVVSVLVVACPCALALATPLAITTSVGMGASRGILISNTVILEVLPRVSHVLLDKTGTLTEGKFAVRDIVSIGAGEPRDILAVAALESLSEHPIGRAIVAHVDGLGRGGAADTRIVSQSRVAVEPSKSAAANFVRHDGEGVTGLFAGEPWFAGNRSLASRLGAVIPADHEARVAQAENSGQTVVFYGRGGVLRGFIVLGDAIRPGAAECISRLRSSGIAVSLISGDASATAHAVARSVGIDDVVAQMLPKDKIERVRNAQQVSDGQRRPVVAMVGDGINDAPALAQADIGIAFGSGTEIARRAADVTLVSDDLSRLADLFTLSQRTAAIIKQNLFWACLYNVVCIPLAMAGLVSPLVAAAAMLTSSLSVIGNSKRLRRTLSRTN